jgi:hypothetical protein
MFKDGQPWSITFMTQSIIKSWRVRSVTCNLKTRKLHACYGRSSMQLLIRKGWVHLCQGVPCKYCASKLECCSDYLWDWKSYDQNGWQKMDMFIPLDWVFWHIHKTIDYIRIPWSTQNLMLQIQKNHVLGGSWHSICYHLVLEVFVRSC